MSDGTRQKITMPEWHVPYLEKHNIYKLFYELARELVIQQPEDHVFFMKFLLANTVKNLHIPHVILLASPSINVVEIGKQIVQQTNQVLITEAMILEILKKKPKDKMKTNEFIGGLQAVMNNSAYDIMKHGWLLVDCIKNKKQAQKLLDIGIMPTHVLFLISPYSPKLTDLLYCNVSTHWPEYRRALFSLRQIYEKKLIEIPLHEFLLHDAVNKCVELIRIEKIENGPKRPRVVIIGPRGSGRQRQAKLLVDKLGIIYINFEYLLCQAWNSDSELGRKLRSEGDKACFHPEILTQVLKKRILDHECLEKGWVLVGYPFNADDFRYMDMLETPPNRVIFLECDINICHERILSRRIDMDTGSEIRLDLASSEDLIEKRLGVHPKSKLDLLNAELQYYCTQHGALRKYCGGTASVINASQPESWVFDMVLAVIARDLPTCSPRNPFDGLTEQEAKAAMSYRYFTPDNDTQKCLLNCS